MTLRTTTFFILSEKTSKRAEISARFDREILTGRTDPSHRPRVTRTSSFAFAILVLMSVILSLATFFRFRTDN
jgi:hypothetical protein